ncbi:MAG: phage tail sheath subtilisin-like domain-containing protein [Anaeromicrobium sp.]|nr:phage tail sheath subtilisin-like domain-containing protein [Anaeromicrobium sp.]MCT4593107.1 phage tail sheath subtilisin-like domain-containing protein [Anaeromicrobium sp.]
MPEYLSPGVYVEEFESGGVPVAGVSTSTAGFIGLAQRGEAEGLPELVTSFADFQRKFGSYLSENQFGEYRFLSYAVEHFFINGGSRAYVMRVAPEDAKSAINDSLGFIKLEAKNPGTWGDRIRILVTPSSKAKTQILEMLSPAQYRVKSGIGFNDGDIVTFTDGEEKQVRKIVMAQQNLLTLDVSLEGDVVDTNILPQKLLSTAEFDLQVAYGDEVEIYEKLSLNPIGANFIDKKVNKSSLIKLSCNLDEIGDMATPFDKIAGGEDTNSKFWIELSGGNDGSMANISAADFMGKDLGPGKRTGIKSFIDNEEVSIMAVPGITIPAVQLDLLAHCELKSNRFAILDIPRETKKVNDIKEYRNMFDTSYGALYHPWLKVFDPMDKRNIPIPPSGSIAGIFARSDNTRGVHKAPANEIVRACVALDCQYNKGEQDILNPIGVNLIRFFTGQGIRVWGARTLSSNPLWRYINVRRLFIFLEESVKRSTDWVVFEPNDEELWARVKRSLDNFLTGVWRTGALAGNAPGDAYFVKIDRTTMTQDDIDNGRLICVIGVSPVKPAEFVIFRFTQFTSESGGE